MLPKGPMPLLRCPKFLRCPAMDACNFERGYSLILFLPPSAALDLRPTSARLVCTPPPHTRRGDPCGRPPRLAPHLLPHSHRAGCTHPAALLALCHYKASAHTGCGNPHPPAPHSPPCVRGIVLPPPRKNAVRPQWSHRMKGDLQFFTVFSERRGQDIPPA